MQPAAAEHDFTVPFPVTCTCADGEQLVLTSEQTGSLQSKLLYQAVCSGSFKESRTHTIDFSDSPITKDILMRLLNEELVDENPEFGWLLPLAADYLMMPKDRLCALTLLTIQKPEILKTFGRQEPDFYEPFFYAAQHNASVIEQELDKQLWPYMLEHEKTISAPEEVQSSPTELFVSKDGCQLKIVCYCYGIVCDLERNACKGWHTLTDLEQRGVEKLTKCMHRISQHVIQYDESRGAWFEPLFGDDLGHVLIKNHIGRKNDHLCVFLTESLAPLGYPFYEPPNARYEADRLLLSKASQVLNLHEPNHQLRYIHACALLPHNKLIVFTGYICAWKFIHVFSVPKLALYQKFALLLLKKYQDGLSSEQRKSLKVLSKNKRKLHACAVQ